MKHELPSCGARSQNRSSILLIAVPLILVVTYTAIFFAVSFPYSLYATQSLIFAIFICSLFVFKYSRYHLLIPLILFLFSAIQTAWFVQPTDPATAGLGLAEAEIDGIYDHFPFLHTEIDISWAIDGFWGHLQFTVLFLLTFYLSSNGNKKIITVLYSAIAVIGIVTIVLGLSSPRDNSKLLWFYSLPKVEVHENEGQNYVSPVVHALSSSLNGFMWEYNVGGIDVSLDQKQISTNPLAGIVNENQYACLLAITFPFVIGLIIRFMNGRKLLMFFTITLAAAAFLFLLIEARSRGAALAVGISLMALLVFRKKVIGYTLVTFLSAFILAIILSLIASTFRTPEAVTFSSGRVVAWHKTLALFANNPLFGIGLGNFQGHQVIIDNKYQNVVYSSHNIYLQELAELGLVGIGVYAVLFFLLIKGMNRKKDVYVDYRLTTISVSILFIILYSAVDYSVSMPFNAMIAAIAFGLFAGEVWSPRSIEVGNELKHVALNIAILMIFVPSIYLAYIGSGMEVQLQVLKKRVGESIILKNSEALAKDMRGVINDSIKTFLRFPYSAEYARQIGLGYLALSRGVDTYQLGKAREWLALSQVLGVEDRYTSRTIRSIDRNLGSN